MSRMVMTTHAGCNADALNSVVLTLCWCVILKGEGCVALRAAQICYTEFHITLTHHGEKTGTLTGGIQLHTTEAKTTEKLYGKSGSQLRNCLLQFFSTSLLEASVSYFTPLSDFIKIERDDAVASKGKGGDTNK